MDSPAPQHLAVTVAWDASNGIWFVEESDLPGLCVEARTLDEMMAVIDDVAPDLLEANVPDAKRDWPLRIQHLTEPRRVRAA
jgi:predicted RNase H-like HicB family nuclease